MVLIISLVTFAAVALFVSYLAQPQTETVRRRILAGATPNELSRKRGTEGDATTRLIRPVAQKFGAVIGKLLPQNMVHHVETMLIQAGEPIPLGTFLTAWFISGSLSVLLTFRLLQVFSSVSTPILVVMAGLLISYGVSLPYLVVAKIADSRKTQIERALPDALDLLLTSVEAGLGIDAGFALVAQRTKGPLAEKLIEYLKQVGLGRSRREALEDIAERAGAPSLLRLASIVAQSGAVGTSLGDVLRIQATELRTARRLKAQEAAGRAPILMTIPLALCFLPAMVAVIVVPTILRFIESVGNLGLLP